MAVRSLGPWIWGLRTANRLRNVYPERHCWRLQPQRIVANTCDGPYPDGKDWGRNWGGGRYVPKSLRGQRRFDCRNLIRLYLDRHIVKRYFETNCTYQRYERWNWHEHWENPCFGSLCGWILHVLQWCF